MTIADRIAALDWAGLEQQIDQHGWATTGPVLTDEECAALAAAYDDDGLYRSRQVSLIVRSNRKLAPELLREMEEIFRRGMEGCGMAGENLNLGGLLWTMKSKKTS